MSSGKSMEKDGNRKKLSIFSLIFIDHRIHIVKFGTHLLSNFLGL